jgi:hypothetical protein
LESEESLLVVPMYSVLRDITDESNL